MATTCSYCRRPATACGSFALMKEPAHWRGLLNGPGGGCAFRVDGSWNWGSVAAMDGWAAKDLIYYNFRTSDPREINWFLYHFVGCRHTADGKNFTFRNASPGVIFTRRPIMPGHAASAPSNSFSLNYTKITWQY